jgi:hypothetical protein
MRRLMITAVLALAVGATAATALASSSPASSTKLASQLALARTATAKYASDLTRAKADGYMIITKMIPSMGYHFLNPKVKGFDIRKPAILVYQHRGSSWQLGALEWVFPKIPAKEPVPGARYGTFGAACHYVDGTFVFADSQDTCSATSPTTGAKFSFWHGPLVTLHIWLWYPNPSGLFSGTNPLTTIYNHG